MPFSEKTVPTVEIREMSLGTVDIVNEPGNSYNLYNRGQQWMVLNQNKQEVKELYSSYDVAQGDVLITGLGFGILALWLCGKPEVTSVTVVEISQDIVDIFKTNNSIPEKLTIIVADALSFTTDLEYDSLLLDHYELETDSWKLKNMRDISTKIKHKSFWAWSLESIYLKSWLTDIEYSNYTNIRTSLGKLDGKDLENPFLSKPNLSIHWLEFLEQNLPNEESLDSLSPNKLNEYVYTYFSQDSLI